MARLSEQLRDLLARVEIVAAGAEPRFQDALRALENGRPWETRSEALAILEQLPHSRVALALWADAAEATLLDHEAAEALERLAREVPFRADVWLRLASARRRLGQDARRELERSADAAEPAEAADAARLELADADLHASDPARAERWLEQLSLAGRATPEALLRRVEAWLDLGELDRARSAARGLPEPGVLDGRGWLVRGRLSSELAAAVPAYERALLLDAPGAERVVAAEIARASDARSVARLRELADHLELARHPSFRAALALAEGRPRDALEALQTAADQASTPGALGQYLELALEVRDEAALGRVLELFRRSGLEPELGLCALHTALHEPDPGARLAHLDRATERAAAWADELRAEVYAGFWPAAGAADWPALLPEIAELARKLGALAQLREAEAIAVDLERPLRVALLGEFNAGKSSFINALLGERVAPVGILPTTASINHLVWAPDRFARIERRSGTREPDRVVGHAELKAVLSTIDPRSIERVAIYAPLELLRRIELIDTPGFNSAELEHGELARDALELAHVVIFVLDAVQPLKESERTVLEQIARLGVPIVVLVNKLDRLAGEAAAQELLAYIEDALCVAKIVLETEPILFSARLALESPTTFERSRWADVERVVEAVLVGRAPELRERALRRKARESVGRLAEQARELSSEARDKARLLFERSERLRQVAVRARTSQSALELVLADQLEQGIVALFEELRPVAGIEAEPGARRFVGARVGGALGPALAERAARWASDHPEDASEIARRLRPRAELLASALSPWLAVTAGGPAERRGRQGGGREEDGRADLPERPQPGPSARARLVELCVDELIRVAEEAAAEPAPRSRTPVEARTEALESVLGNLNLPAGAFVKRC